jgi:tRNA pseudouridine55 synthase
MAALQGDIRQTPPMVSALKINGVPLYKLARKGQDVPREPRLIHIYRFQLTGWQPPLAPFEVVCGKGTYVRTLCHDIGQTLGCGACLEALRRTVSGTFDVKDALPFDDLLKLTREELAARVMPLARIAAALIP